MSNATHNIYQENGYASRDDYLRCMAEDYGVALSTVFTLAGVLGSSEDFDCLVIALQGLKGLDNDTFPRRKRP